MNAEIDRLRARLEGDPEIERLTLEADAARSAQRAAALRLRDAEREVEGHRAKMKSREREMMSGRVRNPSELIQMSQEVDHARERLREEEEAEFELLTASDEADSALAGIDAALAAATSAWEESLPGARARIEALSAEVTAVEAERDAVWAGVPPDYQAAYRRLSKLSNPVAEVVGALCSACRVTLTAAELQQVRRSDHIVHCQNCSRLLVAA